MKQASQKDVDNKLKLKLQEKFSIILSEEEYLECRQSLFYLGRALARWHQISHGKKKY